MREEVLVNHGWRKTIHTDEEGNDEQVLYWDPEEHFEIWYWLTYKGPKGKWKPPANWNEIRKTLVSVGYEYKESYPYPKNSWRSSTEEEVNILKEERKAFGKIAGLKHLVKLQKLNFREDKLILEGQAPYLVSEVFSIPEKNLIIKRWRANDEIV